MKHRSKTHRRTLMHWAHERHRTALWRNPITRSARGVSTNASTCRDSVRTQRLRHTNGTLKPSWTMGTLPSGKTANSNSTAKIRCKRASSRHWHRWRRCSHIVPPRIQAWITPGISHGVLDLRRAPLPLITQWKLEMRGQLENNQTTINWGKNTVAQQDGLILFCLEHSRRLSECTCLKECKRGNCSTVYQAWAKEVPELTHLPEMSLNREPCTGRTTWKRLTIFEPH